MAGDAPIEEVNKAFGVHISFEDFDTIGGLLAKQLGLVPRRGESLDQSGLRFSVMLTRGGSVRWFKVTRLAELSSVNPST